MPDANSSSTSTSTSTSSSSTSSSTTVTNGSSNYECGETPPKTNGQFEVIQIEGQHSKQLVDTRDGVVRVVSEGSELSVGSTPTTTANSFINESPRCCCGPGNCNCTECSVCQDRKDRKKKKVRLKLKRSKKIKELEEPEVEVELEPEAELEPEYTPPTPIEIEEVFVSVGNGLYRKERRNRLTGEVLPDEGEPKSSCCSKKTEPAKPKPVKSGCCSSKRSSQTGTAVGHKMVSSLVQSAAPKQHAQAPLIIAPMNFDGLELSAFDFSDVMGHYAQTPPTATSTGNGSSPLGMASPEDYYPTIAGVGLVHSIGMDLPVLEQQHQQQRALHHSQVGHTPYSVGATTQSMSFDLDYLAMATASGQSTSTTRGDDSFLDVVYAPSCVLPGQCQCGDGCQCEGCSTHGDGRGSSGGGGGVGARVQSSSPSVRLSTGVTSSSPIPSAVTGVTATTPAGASSMMTVSGMVDMHGAPGGLQFQYRDRYGL